MKNIIIIFILSFCTSLFSQSLSPHVLASSGNYYSGSNFTLSWTLGEPVIQTLTGTNSTLTQGFQQSDYTYVAITTNQVNYGITLYPNPVENQLNILIESKDPKIFNVEILNARGQLILSKNFLSSNTNHPLKTDGLKEGIYLLIIKEQGYSLISSIKFMKMR